MIPPAAQTRRGAALVAALAALAAVGTFAALVIDKQAAARRLVARHEASVQADLLARAGLEHAVARLRADRPKEPLQWRLTEAQLVPGATAVVEIVPKKDAPGQFQVRSTISYDPGLRGTFSRAASALLRVVENERGITIERVLPAASPAH